MVSADMQLHPADMVGDHPDWVTVLAWQGRMHNHRGLFINRLQKVGPGHYVSTEPVPVWGDWKTLLRMHDGRISPLYRSGRRPTPPSRCRRFRC